MLFSITKNITRLVFWILFLFAAIAFFYVLEGYKHYSILKNQESTIIEQVKNNFNFDIKYERLDETWKDLIPGIKIKNVVLKDSIGNEFKADNFDIKFDLLALIFENKIKFKNIIVDDVYLKYIHKENVNQTDDSGFDLSIIQKINIEKISFNNFNFTYILPEKTYELKNLSLDYKDGVDYITMKYNNLNLYQYINKDISESKTVIRGDIKDIEDTIKSFDGQKFLDIAQYNKVYSVDGRVRVEINISRKENIFDYEVVANLTGNTVKLIPENFTFTNFKGNIYYSKDKKLYTDNMTCMVNNKPCKFSISNNGMSDLSFNFEAYADKSTIDKYTNFFKPHILVGETKLTGTYRAKEKSADTLNIRSDLVGVTISGLPILNKSSDSPYNLDINMKMSKKDNYLELYGNSLQIFVDFKNNQNTQVYINRDKQLFSPIKENLLFSGKVDNINVNEVLDFIHELDFSKDKNSIKHNFVYKLYVDGSNINYLDKTFDNVKLTNNNNILIININDKNFVGHVNYNLDLNSLNGNFERFYYVVEEDSEVSSFDSNFKISDIPNMKINIKDIKIKNYSGQLSFNGNHLNGSYFIDNIQGAINGLSANFMLKISQEDKNIKTNLISTNNSKLIEFNDIGDILTYYGYSNTMTSEYGVVYGNLSWIGIVPNMKTLSGQLNFELKNGRINAATSGQKVLNVFRIFEMNTLNQLFTLDFDIIKTGLQYSSITGSGQFKNGNFHIEKKNPLIMKSKSFNSSLYGNINFRDENFDNRINVDLPISQKLPTIALIAGGPAAAAGIWIVDKVAGDRINSLMSISFGVKGNFTNPEVLKK